MRNNRARSSTMIELRPSRCIEIQPSFASGRTTRAVVGRRPGRTGVYGPIMKRRMRQRTKIDIPNRSESEFENFDKAVKTILTKSKPKKKPQATNRRLPRP